MFRRFGPTYDRRRAVGILLWISWIQLDTVGQRESERDRERERERALLIFGVFVVSVGYKDYPDSVYPKVDKLTSGLQ